jgi:hypothetical protein
LLNKPSDRLKYFPVDILLRFACRVETALCYKQRMVSFFDNEKRVCRFHFSAHALKNIQRTKWIARPLHKQDRGLQSAQNFIPKSCSITRRAERISETNNSVDFFFQGKMTSNAAAHALADQNCGLSSPGSRVGQRLPMRRHELGEAVWPLPLFSHVGIIENLNIANCGEVIFPPLHPRVRRRRARAGSEKKERFQYDSSRLLPPQRFYIEMNL